MSIQNNVPALAMEEVEACHLLCIFLRFTFTWRLLISGLFGFPAQIAPIAVSDAAMLAPEEVFSGKGNIKEENELTKDDRKKRRARKKRKFKGIVDYKLFPFYGFSNVFYAAPLSHSPSVTTQY